MILTGKCKEDFLEYYWENNIKPLKFSVCKKDDLEQFFESISELFQNVLIIDFFDSVGIYITIFPCIDKTFDSYITINESRKECCQFQPTRPKATNAAIERANEIHNSKYDS